MVDSNFRPKVFLRRSLSTTLSNCVFLWMMFTPQYGSKYVMTLCECFDVTSFPGCFWFPSCVEAVYIRLPNLLLSYVNAIQRLCQLEVGYFETDALTQNTRVDFNGTKWQNERAIRKAVITAIIVACFSPQLPERCRGSCCDEQLSRHATSSTNCCWWFPLFPKTQSQNCLVKLQPLICCIHWASVKSVLVFSYQPTQTMTNMEIHEQLRIQLFYTRGGAETIILPCNGLGVGEENRWKRQRHTWVTLDGI